MAHFPRYRSVLYVPAIKEKAISKAATLDADAIILDLEDAVAPEAKVEARFIAKMALESRILSEKQVIIRVNGIGQGGGEHDWLMHDLELLSPIAPPILLFPKIQDVSEIKRIKEMLAHHYFPDKTRLWLMVETPKSIINVASIASTAEEEEFKVECLIAGTNDLAKEMRISLTPSRFALLNALSNVVLAARAYGLCCIDGVFGTIANQDGLEIECIQGKALGFDGKTLIHPNQIAVANRVFMPSTEEIIEAQAIIEAFEKDENAYCAVLKVNGKMVERLHYEIAKRTLSSLM